MRPRLSASPRAWMLALAGLLALAAACWWLAASPGAARPDDRRIAIGVLGDSDSHAYHDSVLLADPKARGGALRATTLQWTEILDRLRGREVDLGAWGVRGTRGRVAAALRPLGIGLRSPRKEDFEHVVAFSGAVCADLDAGPAAQTPQLLQLMRQDPARWQRGVVLIRIGINDLGTPERLNHYAAHGLDDDARRRIDGCVAAMGGAIAAIRAEHAQTAIVLASNTDDNFLPAELPRWGTPAARARIAPAMDTLDTALAALCRDDPRAVFISYRPWFKALFGAAGADGTIAYRPFSFGGATAVFPGRGDTPDHTSVADGHNGTVVNGLWARDLVALLRERFGLPITPIGLDEIAALADPERRFGLRPPEARR